MTEYRCSNVPRRDGDQIRLERKRLAWLKNGAQGRAEKGALIQMLARFWDSREVFDFLMRRLASVPLGHDRARPQTVFHTP